MSPLVVVAALLAVLRLLLLVPPSLSTTPVLRRWGLAAVLRTLILGLLLMHLVRLCMSRPVGQTLQRIPQQGVGWWWEGWGPACG